MTATSGAIVQWGEWSQWSSWAPSCFDPSSDSIYQDTSKYYPKRTRDRECYLTDNGVSTRIPANHPSGYCPFVDHIETVKLKTGYTEDCMI